MVNVPLTHQSEKHLKLPTPYVYPAAGQLLSLIAIITFDMHHRSNKRGLEQKWESFDHCRLAL
jgi:hypothetical protein